MARADIFVLPTLYEPYGMVFAEATARGVPVVAFDTGGVGEIVVHGETGLLAPRGDEATLGEHLGRLLADASLRREMSARCHKRAARFPTWDDTAHALAHALDEIFVGWR
jgi:glycosyltransferase involved in cell wall biosynthesis